MQKTYFGLNGVYLEPDELERYAFSMSQTGIRKRKRSDERFFPSMGGDYKTLVTAYKAITELSSRGSEVTPCAEMLADNFYVIEKAMASLEDSQKILLSKRLPVCAEGERTGLPRAYMIAAEIVGHRDGIVDEDTLKLYVNAFQAASPLNTEEVYSLSTMLTLALIKLAAQTADDCLSWIRQSESADAAAEIINADADAGRKKISAVISKAAPRRNRTFVERLYTRLSENDNYKAVEILEDCLKRDDFNTEDILSSERSCRTKQRLLLSNIIRSLCAIESMDFDEVFESLSSVEGILRADAIYNRMDASGRAYYRGVVSRIADELGVAETAVAKRAVELCEGGEGSHGHVGYYLIDKGVEKLYSRIRPDDERRTVSTDEKVARMFVIKCLIALIFIVPSLMYGLTSFLLCIIPSLFIADMVYIRLSTRFTKPRSIPRIAVGKSVGAENRTLVVVPVLITSSEAVEKSIERIETHYLSNPLDECCFAVLGDFPDSSEQKTDEEDKVLKSASVMIADLNAKYGFDTPRFFYLHRARQWNRHDSVWMGYERKRGAIIELVRLIEDGDMGSFELCAPSGLPDGIKYCVTLDADTVMPRETLSKLVGAMMHPLNKPAADSIGLVIDGYGMIVPRMETTVSGAEKTPFSRIVSYNCGVCAYSSAVSDFHQDTFGEGIFGGKGIFDVHAFKAALDYRISDSSVLSHDLLEGCFARAGLLNDVALYDSEPSTLISYQKRRHRWIRGDWQLLPYIRRFIKDASDTNIKNPLSRLSKSKIADNILRSLFSPAVLASIVLGIAFCSGYVIFLSILALLFDIAADVCSMLESIIAHRGERDLKGMLLEKLGAWRLPLYNALILPYIAYITLDAIVRSVYRQLISHKKMLEWQTASAIERGKSGSLLSYALKMSSCLLLGAGCIVLSVFTDASPVGFLVGISWLCAPFAAYSLDKKYERDKLTDDESAELIKLARCTWRFFDELCVAKNFFLPPDNYQTEPYKGCTYTTSPTNIGMSILSFISAHDLSFITTERLLAHMDHVLKSIENVDKWHGHLYNWYDVRTLKPVGRKYVSAVDSGNLAASLMLAAGALREIGDDTAGALARRCDAIAHGTDFTVLYDQKRAQFHIGYDLGTGKLSSSWYDMLASEARLTSFTAISLGQIPVKHWFRLGRLVSDTDGGRSLMSWSGTMFEYLMPCIFTGSLRGTLLGQSCRAAVTTQKRFMHGKRPWGISESGYYAFDKNMLYQYKAFGVPCLGLAPVKEYECVVAPYATVLALSQQPHEALKNVAELIKAGALGEYGLYESVDYTPSHIRAEKGFEIVKSYMAHHQGMSMCAINNALNDDILVRRFMAIPCMRASELLLEEKRPQLSIVLKTYSGAIFKERADVKPRMQQKPRIFTDEPRLYTQLLSNGEYTVLVSNKGIGFSKCGDIMVNRWRSDLRTQSGIHICVRDGQRVYTIGRAHSVDERYTAVFELHKTTFEQACGDIDAKLEICVTPGINGELRRLTLVNTSSESKEVEIGAFAEICLATLRDDVSHPAFVKLSVDAAEEDGVLVFSKRMLGKSRRCAYFSLASPSNTRYATDALSIIGRNGTPADAMMQPMLQDQDLSQPLEPYACARTSLIVDKGSSVCVLLAIGFAESFGRAVSDAKEMLKGEADTFELAWSYAVSSHRMSGIDSAWCDIYESFAARLFIDGASKKGVDTPTKLSIQSLWRFGISGDIPIAVICVHRNARLKTVKSIISVVNYFALKNIAADVVLIGEYPYEYNNELRQKLTEMAASFHSPYLHVINAYDITNAERDMLISYASLILDMRRSLNEQLHSASFVMDGPHSVKAPSRAAFALRKQALSFFNGYGGFDTASDEYAIYLKPGESTPLPWCNIVANEHFGAVITEGGGGYTWKGNSHENKLTQWKCDPSSDAPSELLLVCDRETGDEWSVVPAKPYSQSECVTAHGYGYTRFTASSQELYQELTVFVDSEKDVKYFLMRISNPLMQPRKLSFTFKCELALGETPHSESVFTEFSDGILYAQNTRCATKDEFAFITFGERGASSFSCGAFGSESGIGLGGLCSVAMEAELAPGEALEFSALIGQASKAEARALTFESTPDYVKTRLDGVKSSWRARLGMIKIKTGDKSFDLMMNGRLIYQTIASRLFARTGYYQCGGAYGFRDQLQDVLSLLQTEPELAKAHILKCAQRQFIEGDVLHWWHEGQGGIRTYFTDDKLFLPYAVLEYVETTGDTSILDKSIEYLNPMDIRDGEKERYDIYTVSDTAESLYMHCIRAIESAMRFGAHGLVLMGTGDWNDGMNLIGENGGESVWLGWFLLYILDRFKTLCKNRGDVERAETYALTAAKLRESLENEGWDGAWYRRAYFADGEPIGSSKSEQCSIDSISQSWAVFNGAHHSKEALDSAEKLLVDEENGIIKLLTPAFGDPKRDVGYIQTYLCGVRENGGQYTHAAAWLVIAACILGQSARASRLFSIISPIEHTATQVLTNKYKGEPYVVAGDVCSVGKNAGRVGWTWYTGAAGWMYRAGLEYILGIKKRGQELFVEPCCPYESFSVEYRFHSSIYIIEAIHSDERETLVDGKICRSITLADDGERHAVRVKRSFTGVLPQERE